MEDHGSEAVQLYGNTSLRTRWTAANGPARGGHTFGYSYADFGLGSICAGFTLGSSCTDEACRDTRTYRNYSDSSDETGGYRRPAHDHDCPPDNHNRSSDDYVQLSDGCTCPDGHSDETSA